MCVLRLAHSEKFHNTPQKQTSSPFVPHVRGTLNDATHSDVARVSQLHTKLKPPSQHSTKTDLGLDYHSIFLRTLRAPFFPTLVMAPSTLGGSPLRAPLSGRVNCNPWRVKSLRTLLADFSCCERVVFDQAAKLKSSARSGAGRSSHSSHRQKSLCSRRWRGTKGRKWVDVVRQSRHRQ